MDDNATSSPARREFAEEPPVPDDLWSWQRQQAIKIQVTLIPPRYRTAARIPTNVWEGHARASWEASCNAWLDYCGVADFGELHARMLRLYAAGRLSWPQIIPIRGWQPEPPAPSSGSPR